MSDKYANIELVIKSESLLTLGNSANYKKTANWNNTLNGNVTSVSGSNNGDPSYYGLYDTFGQLYEWTETSDVNYPQQKFIRGGSYIDQNEHDLRAIKKFLFYDVLSEGCFGFRICSYTNPNSLDNFVEISGNITDNNSDTNLYDDCYFDNIDTNVYVDPKTLSNIGIVPYIFNISKYLLTNQEYCDYLNSVDPSGTNKEIYDYRMGSTNIGGIRIRKSYENPQDNNYYAIKDHMNNKPATFITWDKAAKYCNWLSNGSLSDISSTVSGSYNMKPIEYISLVSDISLTTEEQDILLKGIPGIADISIDGYELNIGDKILLKNEDIKYNGIYIVVSNTEATNANEYPFYLSRDLSYTLGGQVFKAKNGNNNKNRLFQVGNTCETLSYSQDLNFTKLYECDQGIEVYVDKIFTRSNNAKYFLPTNNEWHKAALYDFSLNKYWKYATKSDETPLSVVCNKQGDAVYPAGYFYPSEKTFPVIIQKTSTSSGGGETGGETGGGTIQQLSGLSANISYFSTPADFQKYIYFINVDISGVKSGRVYNYEFTAESGTNWPTYISPKSGSFTPTNNGIYRIENILKFCPVSRLDSDNIVCNSNLDFNLDETTIQSISEQGSGFLDLNVSISGDNKLIKNNIIIETTNAPIVPKDDIIEVKIQTPPNESNAIIVYDDICEQYIPIVAVASIGNAYTKIGQEYNYEFFTDNTNVSIVPKSGIFFISQPNTKITSVLKLNNENNCKLYIKCTSKDDSQQLYNIYDYINIICKTNCGLDQVALPDVVTPTPSPTPRPTPTPTVPVPTPTPEPTPTPGPPNSITDLWVDGDGISFSWKHDRQEGESDYIVRVYYSNDPNSKNGEGEGYIIEKTTKQKYVTFTTQELPKGSTYQAFVKVTSEYGFKRAGKQLNPTGYSRPNSYNQNIFANYRSLTSNYNGLSVVGSAANSGSNAVNRGDIIGNVWKWDESGGMWGGSYNSNFVDITINGRRTGYGDKILPPVNERGLLILNNGLASIVTDDNGFPRLFFTLIEAAAYCNSINQSNSYETELDGITIKLFNNLPRRKSGARIVIPNITEVQNLYGLTESAYDYNKFFAFGYPTASQIFTNGLGPFPRV